MAILNDMGNLRINITVRRDGADYCWRGKARSITYSGHVFEAIVSQRARRMLRIMWPVWHYDIFPHYLKNGIFSKKNLLNIIYMFSYHLQLISEIFLVLGRIERYVIIRVHSVQQKSIGLKFSKPRTGIDVRYSCHHNSSRFTFPKFAHSCRFSVLHSLQSITPRIY